MGMKLHVYAQQLNHDSAWIVGDRQALYELRHAIDLALQEGNTCIEFEVADGESYSLYVAELGSKEMAWEQLDLPYTDRSLMGFKDTHSPNPPYGLLTPERHKALRAKILKAAEKTGEIPIPERSIGEYSLHSGEIPTEIYVEIPTKTYKAKGRVVNVERSNTYEGPSLNLMREQDEAYEEVVKDVRMYLSFEPGWDGYHAPVFKEHVVQRAIKLVEKLAAVFRSVGDAPDEITPCPCPDGRIDLEIVQGTKRVIFTIDEDMDYIEATIFEANGAREVREEEGILWFI